MVGGEGGGCRWGKNEDFGEQMEKGERKTEENYIKRVKRP